MVKRFALIHTLLFLLTVNESAGQDFYFRHYKVENGLSNNTVLSSLQDDRGFLWFGTKDGLNRFDGYNFKVFRYDSENPKGLGSNFVESLHKHDGKLWVGTDNGLFSYDEEYENFEPIKASLGLPILDIDNDKAGNLWFVADNTMIKYELSTEEIIRFDQEEYFPVEDITATSDGTIWGAYYNTLYKYDESSNHFKSIELSIENQVVLPVRISKVFPLNAETLLVGTQNHGAIVFDIGSETATKLLPESENSLYVRDFALRDEDELWMATESGLYIYDLTSNAFQNLKKNYNNSYALSDNALYSLTCDDENGIWIGSYFGGISYYSNNHSQFKKYFPRTSENSISGNAIREICKDQNGNLWIGTEDAGLNKFNPQTGRFTNYQHSKSDHTLSHYNIHALLPQSKMLWVGTFEHGLDILDIETGKVVKHYARGDGHGLNSNFVFTLYEDRNGNIIAGTPSGLQVYDSISDSFVTLRAIDSTKFYTAILEDQKGNLWAGTYWDGLYKLDPKDNETKTFKQDNNDPASISGNGINGIYEDRHGSIWITTQNGLNVYNERSNDFRTYSAKDGFPSNIFYSIIESEEGILWISTSNGLVAFNPENEEKRIYTKSNGLLSDQFNYNSAFKAEDGTLYFGSVGGLISFQPSTLIEDKFQPPIYITGLQVNNQEVVVGGEGSPLERSITLTRKIVFEPNESIFTLDFAALSFTAPETIEYWYKLEGLNGDWVRLGKKHSVSFTQLPARSYSFRVKALNNNGVWSKRSTALELEVLPVFWKSNTAYLAYVLTLGLLAFAGLRMYDQRIKARNRQHLRQLNTRKEKEIYKAKIEFFTNISHEIRTPLTLIKSPLEKVIQKISNLPDVSEYLSIIEENTNRLLDLVNQLLDFRKAEADEINLTFVETNITNILKNTYERFSEAINDKQLLFRLETGNVDVHAFLDPEAFRKILSNLIGNAITHAENTIIVHLEADKEKLTISVANDGVLIPVHLKEKIFEPFYRVSGNETKTGTGIGLALARSLAEMHHGKLALNTTTSDMNYFVLSLPIHQEMEFTIRPKKNKISTVSLPVERKVSHSHHTTILLVEDSEELLNFLADELKETYLIFKALNAEIAREILEKENIQLIISDVMMPGMNGFELCKLIKTNLETSHIPVILLTSKSPMEAKLEGLESGADAYIEKPFSIKHLKVHVNNLIENRKHIMAYYASSPLAHIKSIATTKTDEAFIKKLDEIIFENMADHDLSVDTLADLMYMSRSTFYRKIKDISNLGPNELINITRLKKSAELLKTGKYRIFEVAEKVGYNSTTSFGRNFHKQFGMTPSEYMNKESNL